MEFIIKDKDSGEKLVTMSNVSFNGEEAQATFELDGQTYTYEANSEDAIVLQYYDSENTAPDSLRLAFAVSAQFIQNHVSTGAYLEFRAASEGTKPELWNTGPGGHWYENVPQAPDHEDFEACLHSCMKSVELYFDQTCGLQTRKPTAA